MEAATNRQSVQFVRDYEPKIFAAREAEADNFVYEYRSFRDSRYSVMAKQKDMATQMSNGTKEMHAQTNWVPTVNTSVQYELPEYTSQALLAKLSDPNLFQFMSHATSLVDDAILQNERDVWGPFMTLDADEEFELGTSGQTSLEERQSFAHISLSKDKLLASTRWMPRHPTGVIAVACSDAIPYDRRADILGMPKSSHVMLWSFKDPIRPVAILSAPTDVEIIEFSTTTPEIIVGGLSNGQICVWNVGPLTEPDTTPIQPLSASSPFPTTAAPAGHASSVSSISWTGARTFVTTAEDGTACTWCLDDANDGVLLPAVFSQLKLDGADFIPTSAAPAPEFSFDLPDGVEGPEHHVHTMKFTRVPQPPKAGAAPLPAPPTHLAMSSLTGHTVVLPLSALTAGPVDITGAAAGHDDPIHTTAPSPFIAELLLTCSGTHFSIWLPGINFPIYTSPPSAIQLTTATWSRSRAAVVMVGRADGAIDAWDLIDRTHEPYLSSGVAMSAITSMAYGSKIKVTTQDGKKVHSRDLIAAGDLHGVVHAVEVPLMLTKSDGKRDNITNERAVLKHNMMREVEKAVYVSGWAEGEGAEEADEEGEKAT